MERGPRAKIIIRICTLKYFETSTLLCIYEYRYAYLQGIMFVLAYYVFYTTEPAPNLDVVETPDYTSH